MRTITGITLLAVALAFTAQTHASSVAISGTHTVPDANINASFGNYRPFKIDDSRLFTAGEIGQGILVEGTVDITGLQTTDGGSAIYIGLIAKPQYDAWVTAGFDPTNTQTDFFGFIDTAYGGITESGAFRLGQQKSFGETFQVANIGTNALNTAFEVLFNDVEMTGSRDGDSHTQAYANDLFNYLEFAGHGGDQPLATDWSQGGYAFVGAFFDKEGGSYDVDLTYSVVPTPAAAATGLMLLGVLGVTGNRRRRRRA